MEWATTAGNTTFAHAFTGEGGELELEMSACREQRGHPMSELIEGVLSQAIFGLPPSDETKWKKASNLIDVVGTLGYLKVEEQQLRPRIPRWEPGAILP
ncbi:hypothetical protein Tco_0178618 [Tanacetum coccineum]